MNEITKTLLQAQFILKNHADLAETMETLVQATKKLSVEITPELQEALDTINEISKQNIS